MSSLDSPMRDIEKMYRFSFGPDFQAAQPRLADCPLWSAQDYYEMVRPEDIPFAKRGVVYPDLVPLIRSACGDAFCYRIPNGAGAAPGDWVFYDHETNLVASLGRSFSGLVRFLLIEMEALGLSLAEDESKRRVAESLTGAVRLFLDKCPRYAAGMESFFASHREMPFFGHLNTPWVLGSLAVAPDVKIPFYLQQRAEHEWRQGNETNALSICEAGLDEDPLAGVMHWFAGMIHAVAGDSEQACTHLAQVVEGQWCTNKAPSGLEQAVHCHANLRLACKYLRKNADTYRQLTRSAMTCDLVLADGVEDVRAWLTVMRRHMDAGEHERARLIAMNGLVEGSCSSEDGFAQCMAVLIEIYQARGLDARVSHLRDGRR